MTQFSPWRCELPGHSGIPEKRQLPSTRVESSGHVGGMVSTQELPLNVVRGGQTGGSGEIQWFPCMMASGGQRGGCAETHFWPSKVVSSGHFGVSLLIHLPLMNEKPEEHLGGTSMIQSLPFQDALGGHVGCVFGVKMHLSPSKWLPEGQCPSWDLRTQIDPSQLSPSKQQRA